jgi:hypothetical protein
VSSSSPCRPSNSACLSAAAAAAAVIDDPFFTLAFPWPGLLEIKTLWNVITPSFHFGTIADSKTTLTPADWVK